MEPNDQTRLEQALAAIATADADALEAQRIAALGKAGWISAALKASYAISSCSWPGITE